VVLSRFKYLHNTGPEIHVITNSPSHNQSSLPPEHPFFFSQLTLFSPKRGTPIIIQSTQQDHTFYQLLLAVMYTKSDPPSITALMKLRKEDKQHFPS
jgi:hypothetical protein